MFRAAVLLFALTTFAPTIAAAQQPCTMDARQVVNELYRHMLERQADAASNHWVQQLESGQMNVREVVRSIANSPEHIERFHRQEAGEGTPYERSVGRLYRHILGRQPDAAGARAHAQVAQSSGPQAVVSRIIDSNEYDEMYGDWGVPGSGGLRYCGPNNEAIAQPQQQPRGGGFGQGRGIGRGLGQGRENRFENLDVNNNGRIEAREWNATVAQFNRLDINNDDVLSRNEFLGVADDAIATTGDYIRVESTQRWTDTGITVRAGDTVILDAQGTVQLSRNVNDLAGVSGTQSGRRDRNAPIGNQSVGALIARIGNSGTLFIGDRRSFRAPMSGRLFLGVNDNNLADNRGDFQVLVTVQER